jgi:hypothetical protein
MAAFRATGPDHVLAFSGDTGALLLDRRGYLKAVLRVWLSTCRSVEFLSMAPDETSRSIRLSEGVRLAIDLVKSGLSEVQRIDAVNDQFHVPMLLVANGFERLMKAILCYRILHDEGGYPGIRSLLVRCTNARPNDLLTPRRWRGE